MGPSLVSELVGLPEKIQCAVRVALAERGKGPVLGKLKLFGRGWRGVAQGWRGQLPPSQGSQENAQ